jgi:hypothetical protein
MCKWKDSDDDVPALEANDKSKAVVEEEEVF